MVDLESKSAHIASIGELGYYKKAPEYTKEQIDAIKRYGEQIKTIKLFVDSVRQNPGEYLSSIRNEGWMNATREVVQNSTDEMNRPESICTKVWVEYFEGTNRCIVSDNGRAIPPEDIIRVFTREHTSVNFTKRKGVYSSGLHGVGAKCTNAVSKRFTVYSYRLGKGYRIDFAEGKPLDKYKMKPVEIPNKDNRQGLVIDFEPDTKIMKEITITCEQVLSFLENLVPLLKIGAEIEYIGHKADKKTVIKKVLVNTDGVKTFLIRQTERPMIKPIIFNYDTGEMKVEVAMTFEGNASAAPNVITFANMTPVNTQLSTPSNGFFQGVHQFFRNYMNKIFFANNKHKLDITNGDVTTSLVAAVSAYHMNVMFDGQAKNVCKNDDLVDFVKQVTIKALRDWSNKFPEDLQKLCEFFRQVAKARINSEKGRENITKKYKTNSFLDLPRGFVKATGDPKKYPWELYIVEGLSAKAPCASGRNPLFQAIFPIRGKMLNAFSTPRDRFLQNEEARGLITVIDSGYGKNFDITRCNYDKIILLPDADYDSPKTVALG